MPARVYLVRHGESGWNRTGRIQGQASGAPGLTDEGWRQAGQLAEQLDRELKGAPVRVVASDLLRAAQTARVLLARLGRDAGCDVRFREIDYGALTGLLRTAPWEGGLAGDRADAVWAGADGYAPGGESVADLTRRLLDGIRDHVSGLPGDGCLVVAAHGGVLRAAQQLMHGSAQLRVRNTAVQRLPVELFPVPAP